MKNLDRIRKEMKPERRPKITDRAAAIIANMRTLRSLRPHACPDGESMNRK